MEAMKDLRAFILVLVILAFVWLFTGGPLRSSSKSGWFLNKSQQKETQKTKKQTEETLGASSQSNLSADKTSASSGQDLKKIDVVSLEIRKAKETNPDEEYIEIKADKKNKNAAKITGWKLKGKTGLDIEIGQGTSYYYYDVASQPQEDISLKPGEKAIIITGTSIVGTNFKLNKCIGYLEQFHEFTPELKTKCPLLKDEGLPSALSNNDQCLDYIDRIFACETIISVPYKYSSLTSSCQDYVTQNANYKTCLEKHKSDADFYLPEWRIYLNRNEELWKKQRETILLYDDKNNIVDSLSY